MWVIIDGNPVDSHVQSGIQCVPKQLKTPSDHKSQKALQSGNKTFSQKNCTELSKACKVTFYPRDVALRALTKKKKRKELEWSVMID